MFKQNIIRILHEDWDEKSKLLHDIFEKDSLLRKEYWRGLVPPNKVVYYIGPLSETGVNNFIDSLQSLEIPFKYKLADWEIFKTKTYGDYLE